MSPDVTSDVTSDVTRNITFFYKTILILMKFTFSTILCDINLDEFVYYTVLSRSGRGGRGFESPLPDDNSSHLSNKQKKIPNTDKISFQGDSKRNLHRVYHFSALTPRFCLQNLGAAKVTKTTDYY